MAANLPLRRELAKRLRRLLARQEALCAEIELVRQLIAAAEQGQQPYSVALRSNSISKLSVQARIRRYFEENGQPARAGSLYELLVKEGISVNPSTFRSYLRRMVEDGILKPEGLRGFYVLVKGRRRVAQTPSTSSIRSRFGRARPF